MCKHYYFTPEGSDPREESDDRAVYESQFGSGAARQDDGTTRRLDAPGTVQPPEAYTQRMDVPPTPAPTGVPAPQPYQQAPRNAGPPPQQQWGRGGYGGWGGGFPIWGLFWLIWPAIAIIKWVLPFMFFGALFGPHGMGPLLPLLLIFGLGFLMRAMRGGRRGWGGGWGGPYGRRRW